MATILCVASGFPSILGPSVELARRLLAAGHRVTFGGLAEAREAAASNGLAFLELEPSGYEAFLREDAAAGFFDRLANVKARRERAAASTHVRPFVEALTALEPDLLLIDGEMHEHIIAASGTSVPRVLLNSFASIWKRPGLPPPHVLARPGVGWRGSPAGIELAWRVARWRKRKRALVQKVRRLGCDRLSILRHLGRGAGLDLRRETDAAQWLVPFTYRRLPVLSLHALELELPHEPLERVHYVGPMILENRAGLDREISDEDRRRLTSVLERRRQSGGSRKLIYAGFGSVFSTGPGLVRRLMEAVASRSEWELLVSLGGKPASSDLLPLSDRIHAFAWLPQLEVLSRADAAVTHGGINTIDECVTHRVPMLVYCGYETDMAGNTARVVHHGLGIAGDRADSASTITAHLDRLMGEPRFAENLESMRRHFAAYAEGRVAERAVAALLAEAGTS